jgi:hypothetical protein
MKQVGGGCILQTLTQIVFINISDIIIIEKSTMSSRKA